MRQFATDFNVVITVSTSEGPISCDGAKTHTWYWYWHIPAKRCSFSLKKNKLSKSGWKKWMEQH